MEKAAFLCSVVSGPWECPKFAYLRYPPHADLDTGSLGNSKSFKFLINLRHILKYFHSTFKSVLLVCSSADNFWYKITVKDSNWSTEFIRVSVKWSFKHFQHRQM